MVLDSAVAHPERACAALLPLAQSCWERCLAIGEASELADSVAGRGSYLAAHNLEVHNLEVHNLEVVRRGLEVQRLGADQH